MTAVLVFVDMLIYVAIMSWRGTVAWIVMLAVATISTVLLLRLRRKRVAQDGSGHPPPIST